MDVITRTTVRNYPLNDLEARRIRRRLGTLSRRLAGRPDPIAMLLLIGDAQRNRVSARLRVRLGHLGGHLVGRKSGETADHAVRLASEQIERQFRRMTARRRAER